MIDSILCVGVIVVFALAYIFWIPDPASPESAGTDGPFPEPARKPTPRKRPCVPYHPPATSPVVAGLGDTRSARERRLQARLARRFNKRANGLTAA